MLLKWLAYVKICEKKWVKMNKFKQSLSSPLAMFGVFLVGLFLYVALSLGYTRAVDVRVKYVIDGDTVIAYYKKRRIKIRLFGIDAPESTQRYGKASRNYLKKLLRNGPIKLVVKEKDKYNRYLGILYVSGKDVNAMMVKAGAAWAYQFYSNAYVRLQKQAKAKRLGLWKDKNPQNPYKYRKGHKWK